MALTIQLVGIHTPGKNVPLPSPQVFIAVRLVIALKQNCPNAHQQDNSREIKCVVVTAEHQTAEKECATRRTIRMDLRSTM